MFTEIIKLIKATNGDLLGVILFILILIYLFLNPPSHEYKIFLIISCSLALLVDGFVVVNILRNQKR